MIRTILRFAIWAIIGVLALGAFFLPGRAHAAIERTICHPNGGCISGESFSKDSYVMGDAVGFTFDVRGTVHAGWPFSRTRLDKRYAGHTVVWIEQDGLPAGNCMVPNANADIWDMSINACGKNADIVESGHWLVDSYASDNTSPTTAEPITAGHAGGHRVWAWPANGSSEWDY